MNSGIVCKVWNVQGQTAARNIEEQLEDSIDYMLDDEKTEKKLELDNSAISDTKKQLERECQYVENDIKTMAGAYVGSRNLVSTDVKKIVNEMMEVKEFYGKTSGRAALHGIISLPESESKRSNATSLMQLCEAVLKEVFPNNQAVFGVHTNTENLHIHFFINSVGLDGRKIHQNDKFMKEVLQPCINKYAKQYGFTQNEKWRKEYEPEKIPFTELKIALRKAIDIAIEKSSDFNQFISIMETEGFKVNVGKYISLKSESMKKAIRTHNLGLNYAKDMLIERIADRKKAFEELPVNNYVLAKKQTVFMPNIVKMKRYKDMNIKEKEYVLHQIRLGNNPWREHQQYNWQLNRIADELNRQERVLSYIEHYSSDGTLQGALKGIIDAKKRINNEKKIIKLQKKRYKPIIDIYMEMKEIERKAYLYEYESIIEYRTEFEKYRQLTKRLKDGYGKDVFEVASFMEECEERILYAHAQLRELSEEYIDIKRYISPYGEIKKESGTLAEVIGINDIQDEKKGIYEADVYYISSKYSQYIVRMVKLPTIDEKGRIIETYEATVLSKNGEIVEEINSKEGKAAFAKKLRIIEEKYNMQNCKRNGNIMLARLNSRASMDITRGLDTEVIKEEIGRQNKGIQSDSKKVRSFTQAINYTPYASKTFIVVDAEEPAYMMLVVKGEAQIKITIVDKNNKIKETTSIPIISKRNSEGYKIIKRIQKQYGFSDNTLTFEDSKEAREYSIRKDEKVVGNNHKRM